jgi:hypothetical protein
MDLAIEPLGRFAARAGDLGVEQIIAVATEATRAAANGQTFLDSVRDVTGIAVRVIDGQEEAALTFSGIAASTDVAGDVVAADIGGGSTELITARDGAVQSARSIPLGSGRLTDRLVTADPPSISEMDAAEREAARISASALAAAGAAAIASARLIVVGGTGEYMARLVPAEQQIDLTIVREVQDKLRQLTAAELAREIDIPEARARVLPAGVAIVAALAERLQPSRIEISRHGIRTGLLSEAFQSDARTMQPDNQQGPMAEDSTPTKVSKKRESVGVDADSNEAAFRDAMRTLIADRWVDVWQTIPAAVAGSDIEGVHDVRVASRRLRAAMDIAAPLFPQRWYKALHRTAKQITSNLGEVRDRDVLLEALRTDRESAPLAEHPGIDRLIARVERERVAARQEMERYLRDLMSGPLREETQKRFGSPAPRQNAKQGSSGTAP